MCEPYEMREWQMKKRSLCHLEGVQNAAQGKAQGWSGGLAGIVFSLAAMWRESGLPGVELAPDTTRPDCPDTKGVLYPHDLKDRETAKRDGIVIDLIVGGK